MNPYWTLLSLVLTSGLVLAAVQDGEGLPFACRLDTLDARQRARHGELREKLLAAVVARRELSDGYAFDLGADPDVFVAAAEWITLERRCCPFLFFGLDWLEGGRVSLRLTGSPGVKEFLDEEIRHPR